MPLPPAPTRRKTGPLAWLGRNTSRLGANLATLAILLIMIVTVIDVAVRGLFGRSVPGMIESAEIILVVAAFLGLGYAQRMKAHVSTAIFLQALPSRLARWVRCAGLSALVVYVAATAVVSAQRAWSAFRTGEVRFGLIEIPQWPARAAIAIGFALLLVEVLRDLRHHASGGTEWQDQGGPHGR